MTKVHTVVFMKARNSLVVPCSEERANWEKMKENTVFKTFANTLWLISKLIRDVKGQQSCLWASFYELGFMKR